jgi:hypothetical protein
VNKQIIETERDLNKLYVLKNANMATKDDLDRIKSLEISLKENRKALKKLQNDAKRKQNKRASLKTTMSEIMDEHPEYVERLKHHNREKTGRPRIETDQAGLHQTIVKLVSQGASADPRRRSEVLNTPTSLDDLTKELQAAGYEIKRSAVYLRLQPKNSRTAEGKRHVETVPVKLVKAQNLKRKQHPATNFAYTSIQHVKEAVSVMGPDVAVFVSCDDKARIPLGLAAANKQAPILMHLDYKVKLPDHDFVIATRHKLIPSVYATCLLKPDDLSNAVSYSGPTFIAIRSGKHDSTSGMKHAADIDEMMTIDAFRNVFITNDDKVKPVFVTCTDGGPDENPRFPRTIVATAKRFKDYDLDVCIVATHAPGHSAYNNVERRMAPLSKELAGIILPHDQYGDHLDSSGRTIDDELELKNFEKAGETLAQIWSNVVLDSHPVVARYVDPNEQPVEADALDPEWEATHVRVSQYLLQIVRCNGPCCGPWRSNWLEVIGRRFLPAPYPYERGTRGLVVPEPGDIESNKARFGTLAQRLAYAGCSEPEAASSFTKNQMEVPYDLYNPVVKSEMFKDRVCQDCGIYFPSKAAVKRHKPAHKKVPLGRNSESEDHENVDEDPENEESEVDDEGTTEDAPIYRNIFEIMANPWVEI